jgi:hypothetical protein
MTADPVSWAARSGVLRVEDLLRNAEGVRCELIDGSLTVTPLGDAEHQDLVGRYYGALVASIPAELRPFRELTSSTARTPSSSLTLPSSTRRSSPRTVWA